MINTLKARAAARLMLDCLEFDEPGQTAAAGQQAHAKAARACSAVPALADLLPQLADDDLIGDALDALRRAAGCVWFLVWRFNYEHELIVEVRAYDEASARRYAAEQFGPLEHIDDLAQFYAVRTSDDADERRAQIQEANRKGRQRHAAEMARQAEELRDQRPTVPPAQVDPPSGESSR